MKISYSAFIFTIVSLVFFSACRERGCTDKMATNYSPQARLDDRSCKYTKGCVDCLALNYDSSAVTNDGSCEYATINHIGKYSVIDSVVASDLTVTRDTYEISFSRDTCGAYGVLLLNYANLTFSDTIPGKINVSAQILGDSLFILPQELNGLTDAFDNDFYSINFSTGFFRNDSVFITISYSDRSNPFFGNIWGKLK